VIDSQTAEQNSSTSASLRVATAVVVVVGVPNMVHGQRALAKQKKKKHFLMWQVP